MGVGSGGQGQQPQTLKSFSVEDFARGSGDVTLEKGAPRPLEEWETVVGDDFSLYYDSYSVDERVDSDSKVCWPGWLSSFPHPSSTPLCPSRPPCTVEAGLETQLKSSS